MLRVFDVHGQGPQHPMDWKRSKLARSILMTHVDDLINHSVKKMGAVTDHLCCAREAPLVGAETNWIGGRFEHSSCCVPASN